MQSLLGEEADRFHAVVEAFLAKHLGGRMEAVGEDFAGSTIQVKVGAEDGPGIEDALSALRPGA